MLAIFKNIKFLVGLGLIFIVLLGGYGLYYHGKQVESLKRDVASLEQAKDSLEAELESSQIVSEVLSEESRKYNIERDNLQKAYKESLNNLKELKDSDEDSRNYLDQPIPERVRAVRERARCISLPYLCGEAGRDEDSKD